MRILKSPKTPEEFSQYYQLRWKILRQPWRQPQGSEQDEQEAYAIHRMILDKRANVLAVGRLEKVTEQQAQIRYVAVDNNRQGQGLGQQIMSALTQQASMLGISEICIDACEQAVSFFQKQGYEKQSNARALFGKVKHHCMIKKIAVHKQHKIKQAQALQALWHKTIALSKVMGLQITYYDTTKLVTRCDTDFNQNLHHTMFAGSIYTLATLTGWGWVYLALKAQQKVNNDLDGDIVLAEANIRYHSPIKGFAYGQVEKKDVSGQFDNLLLGKNARIKLVAHIYCGDNIAATFTGCYFVLPSMTQLP